MSAQEVLAKWLHTQHCTCSGWGIDDATKANEILSALEAAGYTVARLEVIQAICDTWPYRPDVGDERSYSECLYCEHSPGMQIIDGVRTTDHYPTCPWYRLGESE